MSAERRDIPPDADLNADVPSDLHAAHDAMQRLASVDRASAGPTLEDRIFIATRGCLTPPTLRLTEPMAREHPRTDGRRVSGRAWWASSGARIAAALAIVGGGVAAYVATRGPTPQGPAGGGDSAPVAANPATSAADAFLAQATEDQADELLAVLSLSEPDLSWELEDVRARADELGESVKSGPSLMVEHGAS